MICTLRVNYIKFLSLYMHYGILIKISSLCWHLFQYSFRQGMFQHHQVENQWVCAIVRTQRLAMYCGNSPLCDCFIHPCCQIEHFQSNHILLVWIFVCTLCVLKKKSPKKLFHNNIASLEGTVELWYLGHWYLEYSDILNFLNSPSSTAYIHKNFTMFL